MRDLLRVADLSRRDVMELLRLAAIAKADPDAFAGVLDGEEVALSFATPSSRTRPAFETAAMSLGGRPRCAHTTEGARIAVVSTPDHDDLVRMAQITRVPVVNGGTGAHHPTHALADLMTIGRHFGFLAGLRVAYVGDGNAVAASLTEACAVADVDIAVATPPGRDLHEDVVWCASEIASAAGSTVLTTHDPFKAAATAHVVYGDRVTVDLMAEAEEDAIAMHGRQTANRVAMAASVLVAIREGSLEGWTG